MILVRVLHNLLHMLQSFPLQDVEWHVITICKKELAKCLKAQIYTDDRLEFINLDM